METTQTLSNNATREKYAEMLGVAAAIPAEIRNATLTSATWVRVLYQDADLRGPVEGMYPDDRDDRGLWITKVWPHDREPGGYAAARVMIPWSSIRQIHVMAVDTTDQPF